MKPSLEGIAREVLTADVGPDELPIGCTPCSDFVDRCGPSPSAYKDGYLSSDYGFLAPTMPALRLPGTHRAWDDAVGKVPRLYYTQDTRGFLDKLPLLSGDPHSLPDEDLPRAATVLSILASAYWRHGLDRAFAIRTDLVEDELPDAILRPWCEVNQRLGRGPRPYQNVYDLFLNNFRVRSGRPVGAEYQLVDLRIENLDVLVPSFENEPERIFYMSFVEIHAIAAVVIAEICNIERAIVQDSPESDLRIVQGLEKVERSIRQCTATLGKIQPFPGTKTYCDPVLWAKTVAIFAVPPSTYVQGGTSGTATPFAFMMDALISRDRYGTYYGKYVRDKAMSLLPPIHREFTQRIRKLPLKRYILGKMSCTPTRFERLAKAYNRVVQAYAGDGGFLDKHVAKVFNYLAIATLVGRNQSTSGHERHVRAETWNTVAAELKVSISERTDLFGAPAPSEPRPMSFDRPERLPTFRPEQVARHHKKTDGWIVIGGFVFDVTSFLDEHPGGPGIIRGYLGRDVTRQFALVSAHHSPAVRRLLQSFLIGRLDDDQGHPIDPAFPAREATSLLLDNCLRVHGLLDLQYDHDARDTQRVLFRMQGFIHFVDEHLKQLIEMVGDLDPCGPPAPCLDGGVCTWSPEMRRADWLNEEQIRRLRLSELVDLNLRCSLNVLEEFIEITAYALEAPTVPAVLQVQLWAAVVRWRDALSEGAMTRRTARV